MKKTLKEKNYIIGVNLGIYNLFGRIAFQVEELRQQKRLECSKLNCQILLVWDREPEKEYFYIKKARKDPKQQYLNFNKSIFLRSNTLASHSVMIHTRLSIFRRVNCIPVNFTLDTISKLKTFFQIQYIYWPLLTLKTAISQRSQNKD